MAEGNFRGQPFNFLGRGVVYFENEYRAWPEGPKKKLCKTKLPLKSLDFYPINFERVEAG